MNLLNAFTAILLTQAALAVPLLQGNVSELHVRDSSCIWEDPWGIYSCDTYLITLGAYRSNAITPIYPDYGSWVKSHVVIRGKGFIMAQDLICGQYKKEKGWDDHWTSFEHADLPSRVSIHGGHACTEDDPDDNWDNVWIEWSDQHLDVPSDKRCSRPDWEEDGNAAHVNCYVKM